MLYSSVKGHSDAKAAKITIAPIAKRLFWFKEKPRNYKTLIAWHPSQFSPISLLLSVGAAGLKDIIIKAALKLRSPFLAPRTDDRCCDPQCEIRRQIFVLATFCSGSCLWQELFSFCTRSSLQTLYYWWWWQSSRFFLLSNMDQMGTIRSTFPMCWELFLQHQRVVWCVLTCFDAYSRNNFPL